MSYSIDIASIINNLQHAGVKRTRGTYALNAGDVIDGLRVESVFGEGGQGEVYRVYDESLDCYLALKLLHRAEQAFIDAFQSEMKLLASLRHPNIIQIKRAGVWDGRPYYVMEMLERLPESPSEDDVYHWVLALCEAVQELGKKGLVHGDIKPDNVLWDAQHQQPVLTDFGTATEVGGLSKGGTPGASSPEQLSVSETGAAICVTATSDVFALGNFALSVLPNDVAESARWRDVLAKATSSNEQLRYASASEFAQALERAYKRAHHNPWIARGAVALLVVCVVTVLCVAQKRRAEAREQADAEAYALAQKQAKEERIEALWQQIFNLNDALAEKEAELRFEYDASLSVTLRPVKTPDQIAADKKKYKDSIYYTRRADYAEELRKMEVEVDQLRNKTWEERSKLTQQIRALLPPGAMLHYQGKGVQKESLILGGGQKESLILGGGQKESLILGGD